MGRTPRTPQLFTPIQLRELHVAHRLWVAAMCQYSAVAGVPQAWHAAHLGSLAIGRAGLIVTEATAVTPEGRISPEDAGLWNAEQQAAWAGIVEFSHQQGVPMAVQLAHAGRKASTFAPFLGTGSVPHEAGGWITEAPSATPYEGFDDPRALHTDEITQIVTAFRAAARRAVDVGFDAIEVHGAHGYLLHQFLSPLSNQRTDEYGGSFENRSRLLLRVVREIRAEVPSGMPLFVRLSATDWVPGGWNVDETSALVAELRTAGVDLVSISTGGNDARQQIPVGPGYQVPFSREVRRRTEMPVGVAGLITQPAQAETVLVDGAADVVFAARQFLREPGFALRAAAELGAELVWPRQYRLAKYPLSRP